MVVLCKRQQLYEEVWAEPMRDVARRYGISDVGLAKICKRLCVPVPGRGYWAQHAAGQETVRTKLPKLREGAPTEHRIERWKQPASVAITDATREAASRERRDEAKIVVSTTLVHSHDLVERSAPILRRLSSAEHPSYPKEECLDVQVTKPQLERALLIFSALLKAATERGFAVTSKLPDPMRARDYGATTHTLTQFIVGKEKVEVGILEGFDSVMVRPPKRKYGDGEGYYTPPPERQRQYNGELALRIKNAAHHYSFRRTWSDSKKHKLEEILNAFMAGLITAADAIRAERLFVEARDRARKDEADKQAEAARVARKDEQHVKFFRERLDRHRFAVELKKYVEQVRAMLTEGDCKPTDEFEQHLLWASEYAERTDPLAVLRREIAEIAARRQGQDKPGD